MKLHARRRWYLELARPLCYNSTTVSGMLLFVGFHPLRKNWTSTNCLPPSTETLFWCPHKQTATVLQRLRRKLYSLSTIIILSNLIGNNGVLFSLNTSESLQTKFSSNVHLAEGNILHGRLTPNIEKFRR